MINRIVSACILAATLSGSIVCGLAMPSFEVIASPSQPEVKGVRLDIRPLETACGQQTWPYYSGACVVDLRRPDGRARGPHRIL